MTQKTVISIASLRKWAEETNEYDGSSRVAPSAVLALVEAVEAAREQLSPAASPRWSAALAKFYFDEGTA